MKCGKERKKLIDGFCPECYFKDKGIKIPKRLTIQVCQRCKAIKWHGIWTQSEFDPEYYLTQDLISKIKVPEELSKGKYGSYFTFVGKDSIEFLKAYFKQREKMKPDDYLFTKHGTCEKACKSAISTTFGQTIQKLKDKGHIDFEQKKEGRPRTIRLYSLRKWFRKQAMQA